MTLDAWLDVLDSQHNSTPLRDAHARCRHMLERLKLKKFCPIITVGGTNGKGSTTHFLAAYATKMGKKVGRYTSPHLSRYNERIAIDGLEVTDAEIIAAFERIKAVQDDLYLSYFDYSFLAAFICFDHAGVEVMILEVGLGGRLDSTNSVDTDCAVLTTIDFDHMGLLGHTREAIGFEKAGIFRPGRIAISGDPATPRSVRDYAQEIGARFFERGVDFDWETMPIKPMPEPHFPIQNALTALQVVLALQAENILNFNEAVFCETLRSVRIPGRMQMLQTHPEMILDVAHNVESVGYLMKHLKSLSPAPHVYAVFSALQDKEVAKMIAACEGVFSEWSVLPLDHPRAMPFEALLGTMPKTVPVQAFESIEALMDCRLNTILAQDRIVVFGSFAIVSLILNWYEPLAKLFSK